MGQLTTIYHSASQGIGWSLLDSMGLCAHMYIPTQRHVYLTHIHVIEDNPKSKELWEGGPLAEEEPRQLQS